MNNSLSAEFESTNGAFQGDSLSGTMFTLTLAGALNHLRAVVCARPNPPFSSALMPLESEYGDDVDFMDTDLSVLEALLPTAKRVLEEWYLFMNEGKTEQLHMHLAKRSDVDSDGNSLVDNEEWRSSKLLGSLLCSVKDINRRIVLGNIAFNNFKNVWMKGRKISLSRRLNVYDAQVVSIILYNSGCWAAPEHVMNKLDTCHRKHLRSMLNIRWPNRISNEKLYSLTKVKPLTVRVEEARWKLFGHILRSSETTPASMALMFAADSSEAQRS